MHAYPTGMYVYLSYKLWWGAHVVYIKMKIRKSYYYGGNAYKRIVNTFYVGYTRRVVAMFAVRRTIFNIFWLVPILGITCFIQAECP